MHAHDYREPSKMVGKRVLVIGLGNSSCDIVCETARVAARTILSTRRGAHIIPKYMFGWAMDRILPPWCWRYLPFPVLQFLFATGLYLSRGRVVDYGLPKPTHRVLQEHPTISADLLNILGHGDAIVKPTIKELRGSKVLFIDGTEEEIDVIVYATGYNITFPFLDKDVLDPADNQVPLYRNVIHPGFPGLYFIGLVQPWGAIMPLAEAQSEWAADLIQDRCGLPQPAEMRSEMQREHEKMAGRYTQSSRHTIQVDFFPYIDQIRRERRRKPAAALVTASKPALAHS
jgi:cation diffusion facilitator CzcD-associated flavoprotein CzcO